MYKTITVQCVIVLLCTGTIVRSMEKTSMYMKKSELNDQSMSGSGYSYNVHDGKPEEYSFEVNDNNGEALKILKDLGYEPFSESQRYAEEKLPEPYEHFAEEYSKIPKVKPLAFILNEKLYKIPVSKAPHPHISSYSQLGLYPKYPYAPGYGHDAHSNFLTTSGKSYNDYNSAKNGEKFDSGYKTLDEFNKGLKGKYDNTDTKSFYDQSGGKKQLAYDSGANYAANHAEGKISQGGSYGHKDSHNKGSKTTGYHKVYHKDDYNKQHKFYDKADQRGHFNKYGDHNVDYGNSEGQFAKGAHSDSGHNANKFGISDVSDKGKFEDVANGFRKAAGKEGFYQDYAGYSDKGGKESGSHGGYIK